MNHSGIFRSFLSVVSVSITTAALVGASPARGAVTIDAPCAGTWNWNAATQTLSCTGSPPPAPGAPTACVLTANPSSLTAAGPVSLSVSCQGTVTSYAWSASPSVAFTGTGTTTGNQNGADISANTTFTVTATNGVGSAQASRTVQVGGVVGGLSCPGFTRTLLVNWDWATVLTKIDTWQVQNGLGTNGILVVPFTPTGPADNAASLLSATGYPAPNMGNELRLAISTQPCDLNPPAPAAASGPSPSVFYVIGTSPVSGITGRPTKAALTPGVQYYINVAGRTGVSASSPSGSTSCVPGGLQYPNCEVRLSIQKPAGH